MVDIFLDMADDSAVPVLSGTHSIHLLNSYNANKQIDVDFVKPIVMLF